MRDISQLTVSVGSVIEEAMLAIDRGRHGIALLVDGGGRFVATITDGDIRRAILAGATPSSPIELTIKHHPPDQGPSVVATVGTPTSTLLALMQARLVKAVPVLDSQGRAVELALLEEALPTGIGILALVMAGGYGMRLRPLTSDIPKPMLLVSGKPVLAHILEQLVQAGIRHVVISTHHKPEVITSYFGDGSDHGISIRYIHEENPTGTAGALRLMDKPVEPLLVINGDILTRVDLRAAVWFHRENRADMTVAVRMHGLQVPYGVVELDGSRITQLVEKPTVKSFVNAGIYILEPTVFSQIKRAGLERYDMTDLICELLLQNHFVAAFPIMESWIDIGLPSDYARAEEEFGNG